MAVLRPPSTRNNAPCSRRQRLLLRSASQPYPSATEIADASRRRRVRRHDPQTAKRPEPADLEERFKQALIAEDAKWIGPSEKELIEQTMHPMLEGLLETIAERMMRRNGQCSKMFSEIFENKFPVSRPVIDYVEFHLLEVDGKGVVPIIEFFQDLGYKEKRSFVLQKSQKPVQCKVLDPPTYRNMPKIVLSYLNVNEELSERCQKIIHDRMSQWLPLADKHGATAFGVVDVPWDFPTEREYEIIEQESSFAARCMAYGHLPSCLAISVNEMRKVAQKFGTSPGKVTQELIVEALADSYPLNPTSPNPIWENSSGSIKVVAPVAEVIPSALQEGLMFMLTGSHVAFIDRSVLPEFRNTSENGMDESEPEHLDQDIDEGLLTFMHGSIETALIVDAHVTLVHETVMERAQSDGKVLTLDGSNEEDEDLYKRYCTDIAPKTPLPTDLPASSLREMSARSFVK